MIIFPTDLNDENCLQNLQIKQNNIFVNQEVVLAQLNNANINVINTFLSKYDSNFLGKIYNVADCPPGFEGALCLPCGEGYFKPFYGSRSCVECPCTIIHEKGGLIQKIRRNFSDCECIHPNWAKMNFGLIFWVVFIIVGFGVFLGVELLRKYRSPETMTLTVKDIPHCLFFIDVHGGNSPSSPFRIIQPLDEKFLQVRLE